MSIEAKMLNKLEIIISYDIVRIFKLNVSSESIFKWLPVDSGSLFRDYEPSLLCYSLHFLFKFLFHRAWAQFAVDFVYK